MERKKLSPLFINLFGLGDFGFTILTIIESYFFIVFLYQLGMDSAQVGILGGVTAAFDVAWVFVAAGLVTRFNFKWGKLRSWMLIAPPLIFVFFVMNYWAFFGSGTLGTAVIAIGFILSHLVWNCSYAANIAMISSYTDDPQERALLSSRKSIYGTAGGVVFSLIGLNALYFIASPAPPASAYTIFTAACGILMVVCYFAMFILTKPYEKDTRGLKQEEGGGENISTATALKTVIKNDQLWVMMIAIFAVMFASFVIIGGLVYFFQANLKKSRRYGNLWCGNGCRRCCGLIYCALCY